jgi:hypothetical protein
MNEKVISVYKFIGFVPTISSRSWLLSNPNYDSVLRSSREFGEILINKNIEFITTKEEPYYSELMKSIEVGRVKNFEGLTKLVLELNKVQQTNSFTREQIETISVDYEVDAWKDLFWLSRLVRAKQ